jgi:hypothetical protein
MDCMFLPKVSRKICVQLTDNHNFPLDHHNHHYRINGQHCFIFERSLIHIPNKTPDDLNELWLIFFRFLPCPFQF